MTGRDLYARAGAIFDDVVALDDAARADAIARAAAEDPVATELAQKLLAHDRPGGLLGLGDPAKLAGDPAAMIGARIEPYTVDSFIGRGGMGAVYRGRRANPDAVVAIKFVTLSAAPAEALERFRRETEWLAALDHPGIVRYRGSGVDDAGRPYLVMDFVAGEPLTPAVPEVAASVDQTVSLVVDLADAVHHLHQKGVLHRDIKPSNVLLARRGEQLSPIVIDLGIARTLASAASASDMTGTVMGLGPIGTPAYMAPEQRSPGSSASPDVRSDVYSLGAVLYHLLTGDPPDGENATPPSILVDEDVFGSSLARQRARSIPRDLEAIVLKTLATRKEDRYGSAEAFGADLLRWQGGLPIVARRIGPAGKFRRLLWRRPLESISIAAVVVALVTTAIITSLSLSRERRLNAAYIQSVQQAESYGDFLLNQLIARVMPALDGPDAKMITVLENAFASVETKTERTSRAIAVGLGTSLAQLYDQLGRGEDATAMFERLDPVVQAIPAGESSRMRYEFLHASRLMQHGHFVEAASVARSVWDALEANLRWTSHRSKQFAAYRAGSAQIIASSLEAQDRLDDAVKWFDRGLAVDGLEPKTSIFLHHGLAFVHQKRGDVEHAVGALEQVLQMIRTGGDPKLRSLEPTINSNIAHWLNESGSPDRALPFAERAVATGEAMYPDKTHPHHLVAIENLGSSLHETGDFDGAITRRREALNGNETRYGPDDPNTGERLVALADSLSSADPSKHEAEIRSLAERAIELFEPFGDEHSDLLVRARAHRDAIETER